MNYFLCVYFWNKHFYSEHDELELGEMNLNFQDFIDE